MSAVITAAATVFSNHGPPPPISRAIGRIAPRSVLLIYADARHGRRELEDSGFYQAARGPKADLGGAGRGAHGRHRGAARAEYERRVVAFFDRALLEPK